MMQRTTVHIDDRAFPLAQGTDIGALKAFIEEAARLGGKFVDITIVGNRALSVLVTGGIHIVFETASITLDKRDTGDVRQPFEELQTYIPDDFYGS
jgi:hypothetical protein